MKKITLYTCIVLMLAFLAAGCSSQPPSGGSSLSEPKPPGGQQEDPPEDPLYISLYYLEPDGRFLFPLSFSYNHQATPKDLVRALSSGPLRKEWGKSPIPPGLAIKEITLTGDKALVNLQPGSPPVVIDPRDEEILVKSLVFSLTSLPDLTRVEFLQEGEVPGEPFELLASKNFYAAQDLILNPLDGAEETTKSVRLWFSNHDILYMVPVSLPLEEVPQDIHELALLLIQALIEGPGEGLDLISPFPEGTEVLSLKVAGRVLEVDFNRAFKTNFSGGSSLEWAVINSLVLTLTEMEGVEEVQILVEGRKEEAALGHMDTAEPIIRGVVNWVLSD